VKSIGVVATTLVTAIAVGGVVIGLRSIPDIKRYLKMRNM
jgi:uncharacterized protein DUF6893